MHFFGNVKDWGIDNFEHHAAITPLPPAEAKELFMQRYRELKPPDTADPFNMMDKSRV
jgi:hypothetical protein